MQNRIAKLGGHGRKRKGIGNTVKQRASKKRRRTRLCLINIIRILDAMSANTVSVSDILLLNPYRHPFSRKQRSIASVDQSDLQFLIPGDNDTYLEFDIKLYSR